MPSDPGVTGRVIQALSSADPSFDFARNVLEGIHRASCASCDDAEAETSPPTPLSDLSPSPSSEGLEDAPFDAPLSLPLRQGGGSESIEPDNSLENTRAVPRAALHLEHAAATLPPATNPASTPRAEPSRLDKRKARQKASSRRSRKKKKTAQEGYVPEPQLAKKQLSSSHAVSTAYSAESFGIASTGYVSPRTKNSSTTYGLDQLVGPNSRFGFGLQKWDAGNPIPIVDDRRRVYGVCAGVPKDDASWDSLQMRAASLLEASRPALIFKKKDRKSRRGNFSAINVGISHGGGQTHPKVLSQHSKNAPILEDLMADEAFQRISGFSTGAFASWAPRLYRYQNDCVTELIERDQQLRRENKHPHPDEEELRRNWPKTPWASAALNFGPQTVCYRHADYNNLAFGWCAITALGSYDYKKGGHLVLWDLKLIIEFPPGSTILIPSSAVHHSNTRIQAGERRYSFTQYSAGGLFRWLENDFKAVKHHRSTLRPEQTASLLEELSNQLEFGLSLFSTVEELELTRNISIRVPPPEKIL